MNHFNFKKLICYLTQEIAHLNKKMQNLFKYLILGYKQNEIFYDTI